jgi:hypothetical protein
LNITAHSTATSRFLFLLEFCGRSSLRCICFFLISSAKLLAHGQDRGASHRRGAASAGDDPPDASELWSLCRGWSQEKRRLRSELAAGCYRFGLLSHVTLKGGEVDRHLAAPRRLGAKGALAGVGTVLWILDQMLLGKGPRRKQARRAQRLGSSHHQSLFTTHRREGFLRSIDHDVLLDGLRAPGSSLSQSPHAPIPRYAALTTYVLPRP